MTSSALPSSPTSVSNDASNRAVRTLVQGLVLDVLAAVLAAAVALLTDVPAEWSWGLVGAVVAKSALQAALSYYMRVKGQLPGLLATVIPGEVAGQVVTVVNNYLVDKRTPGVAAHGEPEHDERG